MSKSFKVRRRTDPKKELKREVKRVNWRLVITVFAVTLLIFTLYQLALILEFKYIIHIYAVLAGILALTYGIMNRGFTRFEEYTEAQRALFTEKEKLRRKKAKLFLIPLIGILITLAIDTVYLFYIEPIIR